ncbi:glycosyltransferase family 2 protein [Peniophora sp. CONT]|nr:glycosyltransferase family 2 protein [Peniophora sp. CONT]
MNGHRPLTSRPVRATLLSRISIRSRLSLLAGLIAVLFVIWITPTPKNLYTPQDNSVVDAHELAIQNSIVIPAYNEAPNMDPLVRRVFDSLTPLQKQQTEILIIDDNSPDTTSLEISKLREEGYNVHLHVREVEKGLSSAVLHGFSLAAGDKLLVMDADLQHPPESVQSLLEALDETHLFALGTRYGKGVEMDKDWPVYRRIISWGARLLSRPLTAAQDPMGGFFALNKKLFLSSQPLNPSGFKIGLELLLKTPLQPSQLTHVPYGFAKRQVGSSKLGLKVIFKYIGQLLALYQWRFGAKFYLFLATFVALGVWTVLRVGEEVVKRFGWEETVLGGLLAGAGAEKGRRKKDKWIV